VTAVGSKKMAVYDDVATEERIRVLDKGVDPQPGSGDFTQPPMSYRYGDILVPYLASDEPLGVQDRHFVDSVLRQCTPLTDGENGLAVVEVLEAAQLSLRLGRPVPLYELAFEPRLIRTADSDGGEPNGPTLPVPRRPGSVTPATPKLTLVRPEAG